MDRTTGLRQLFTCSLRRYSEGVNEQLLLAGNQRSRGASDAWRAAAPSGVPKTTLHFRARTGFFVPSVSAAPRVRLWSWLDVLALRAIDWCQ